MTFYDSFITYINFLMEFVPSRNLKTGEKTPIHLEKFSELFKQKKDAHKRLSITSAKNDKLNI